MNRKVSVGILIAIVCITCAMTMSITTIVSRRMFNKKVHNISQLETMYNKIAEIDKTIRKNYIEDIDDDYLLDSLARGFIFGIKDDKNGKYITAKKYKEIRDIENGKLVGIGVIAEKDVSGYMKIIDIYDESLKNKIKKSDLIIKINDIDVSSENYEECESMIIGEPGTTVNLVVRHGKEDIELEIVRNYSEIKMLTYRQFGNIGYIKIVGFNDSTVSQFNKAIRKLLRNKVKGIVFDLRNNPGGTLKSVCAILEPMLPREQFVMMTLKDGSTKKLNYRGTNKIKIPLVTIINQKSASAAELFAQALKDYNRTKIVGVNSFGKGTMQHIFELRDGSALNLTFAKFKTLKSPNFDGVGVKPDFEIRLSSEQEASFELLNERTDPQLKKSLELLKTK
ncbi:MAG: hypothetical protein J6C55_03950 [Oscillospiraceae bacterium]|nr:hypothetical protein [Oscillospiraceae bacterium]